MKAEKENYFTPKEFCELFSISIMTFYNWQKQGKVKNIIKIGRKVYVSDDEIRRIVRENRIHIKQPREVRL